MKAYWVSGGIAPCILDIGVDGGEWLASRPGCYTPRERTPGIYWIGGRVGPRAVHWIKDVMNYKWSLYRHMKSSCQCRLPISNQHKTIFFSCHFRSLLCTLYGLGLSASSELELHSKTMNHFRQFVRTSWTGDRTIARPLAKQDSTTHQCLEEDSNP